jgi:exodeoxyribonuclease-3
MKLISWNVNGLRAVLNKGFVGFIENTDPDIFCIQETKAQPEQVLLDLPQYQMYWNSADKKGYAGVATFTKIEPLAVWSGMGIEKHDREGRVLTLEFSDYYLVNVYTPNSQRGLFRLDYRTREWDVDFLNFLKNLEQKKPVIFCGDLNVAHKEIDIANPKGNRRNAGFTDEERGKFDAIINSGFIDTFREFVKEGGFYTWWSYLGKAREKNVGWRIDYFCISPALRPRLQNAYILPEVTGSDHCPIVIELQEG